MDRAAVARSLALSATTKFLLLDHDAKYGIEVPEAVRSMNIHPVRTVVGWPWQNGVAERWVGGRPKDNGYTLAAIWQNL